MDYFDIIISLLDKQKMKACLCVDNMSNIYSVFFPSSFTVIVSVIFISISETNASLSHKKNNFSIFLFSVICCCGIIGVTL